MPAWPTLSWVRLRFAADILALPLNRHPPPDGGTAMPASGATPVPVSGTFRVCVPAASVQVSWYTEVAVPGLVGVKVTGTCTTY